MRYTNHHSSRNILTVNKDLLNWWVTVQYSLILKQILLYNSGAANKDLKTQ